MNHWDTTELFDAIVLNNGLSYADDPSQMFERTLEWLAEDGLVIVAMYRGLGTAVIWSRIDSAPVELVAACAVRDYGTGRSGTSRRCDLVRQSGRWREAAVGPRVQRDMVASA